MQNSLLKLQDYQQCLEHSELSLNEALQQLNSASTSSSPSKDEWVSTIRKLLDGIDLCFTKDAELLKNVHHFSSMARLANNLIQVKGTTKNSLFHFSLSLTLKYIIMSTVSCCFQLIDLSMAISDDPKEPYFFSVLPWIILYRIIKHEEAAFDCMLRQHMSVGDDEGLLSCCSLGGCVVMLDACYNV